MRAVHLLSEVVEKGETIDRSGHGRFVEVYPAAALSIWGFRSTGYKRVKGASVRNQLVTEFVRRTERWLELGQDAKNKCKASDDAFDALIAALVARAAATGHCETTPPEDLDAARKEGWIALPEATSLDKLLF